ncbi:hypothetical protein [Pleurocapsa sp. FMAR1]|nr:hypothetical protein [Pleurocapsa sp. FMAR1]
MLYVLILWRYTAELLICRQLPAFSALKVAKAAKVKAAVDNSAS